MLFPPIDARQFYTYILCTTVLLCALRVTFFSPLLTYLPIPSVYNLLLLTPFRYSLSHKHTHTKHSQQMIGPHNVITCTSI